MRRFLHLVIGAWFALGTTATNAEDYLPLKLDSVIQTSVGGENRLSIKLLVPVTRVRVVTFIEQGDNGEKAVREVAQSFTVIRPTSVPIEKVSAWNIEGQKLESQELADRLAKNTSVFQLQTPWPENTTIDPVLRSVIRDDVLFLYTPPVKDL